MAAPLVCSECFGRGWRPYRVETVEGEVEWAWELCPECRGGDAFPRRKVRRRKRRVEEEPHSACSITVCRRSARPIP